MSGSVERRGLHAPGPASSEVDNGANALAFMHQVKGVVDLLQAHGMGDEGIQRDFAALRLLDVAGQLGTPLHATEGTAAPDAAGPPLERTGASRGPGRRH